MNSREITRFFKGVAILSVFICHSHQSFTLPGSLNYFFSFFQVGVQLFMLVSGMGLCFSYHKTPVRWCTFMKKRLAKIAVLYWFAIALAAAYRTAYAFVTHSDMLQALNLPGILFNALFLHGLSPDSTINNHIVRGGWFIGTLVLYYALFPLLYRLYFNPKRIWAKYRVYLFPLSIFAASTCLYALMRHYRLPDSLFHLVSQLSPFCLGLPLFDLQRNNAVNRIKHPFYKCSFFALLALVLYFAQLPIATFYIFSIFIAFFYAFLGAIQHFQGSTPISKRSPILTILNAVGEHSFPVYLTHSYIAFDLCAIARSLLTGIYANDLLWFVLLQPFVIALSYSFGKLFHQAVNLFLKKAAALRRT